MLRVIGRKLDSNRQNVAYLVFNEDDYTNPARWVNVEQLKSLLNQCSFINFNKQLEATDSRKGTYGSIPIYTSKDTIRNPKKAILLWGLTKDDFLKGYAFYLNGKVQCVLSKDLAEFSTKYGILNASYLPDTNSLRPTKGTYSLTPIDPFIQKPKEVAQSPSQSLLSLSPVRVAGVVQRTISAKYYAKDLSWVQPWHDVDNPENIDYEVKVDSAKPVGYDPWHCIEETLDCYCKKYGVRVEHRYTNVPCFMPYYNTVYIPMPEQFKTVQGYYATTLHELSHSTCLILSRPFKTPKQHAFEEMVGEFCGVLLMSRLGIEPDVAQASAYIAQFVTNLNEGTDILGLVIKYAHEAVGCILRCNPKLPRYTL